MINIYYKSSKFTRMPILPLLFFFFSLFMFQAQCTILLYHLQITQQNQTFTQTFNAPFKNFPVFACYLQGGSIQNNEFSLTFDQTVTTLTNTQITINFLTYKPSSFNSESLNVALLITDDQSTQFSIGVRVVNVTAQMTFNFPNLTLVQNNLARGIIEIYSLSYPMIYTESIDLTSTSNLLVSITKSSLRYQNNIYFGYIFYTNNYIGQNVAAIFKEINQGSYTYLIPYQPFAFTPSSSNIMFAFRQYDTTSIPYFSCQLIANYNYIIGANPQMMLGYVFASGAPTKFNSDVFLFNASYSGCPDSKFLYYLQLYQTLPYSCVPCDSSCLQCAPNSTLITTLTGPNNCISCTWLRYLNATSDGNGNCVCLLGLTENNGVCSQCLQACLTFTVAYIETTNTSNFLLSYSFASVVESIPLDRNLVIYLNGIEINFNSNQQQNSFYIINLELSDMNACEGAPCQIQFYYLSPQSVLTDDLKQSLCMNNVTLTISNFINYYSEVPANLQQAFIILGIAIGMAFSGGYSSLVTILFELEQLIDAHRYLKLTLPVIFNELLKNMLYFRFLSILNLLPYSYSQTIQNFAPQDLDNKGPPKLQYYESGLNFYKNTITAFISVVGILLVNSVMYVILRLIPLKITKKLAKKIAIRKFITIHDTLEQLQFPFMYLALEQLQVVLLHPNLIWVYALAITVSCIIIAFPFIIVLYIYSNKDNKANIEIYEDLMQDNSMNQKVTYIYYVFNYYRKVLFAMCLLSIFPGLIQIYFLIILNTLHLAFQVYLVVSRTFKSKMKLVVRFINDICIITIEVLILLYNLNDYSKNTMIKIGMTCLYLAVVTTIMGIIDVIVKIIDTCQQQLRSKHQEEIIQAISKAKAMKEFKGEIKCNIGEELQEQPKDPKEIKFLQDKELMENTFNKEDDSQNISIRLENHGESHVADSDLVFIDEDWMDIYPDQPANFKPKLKQSTGKLIKQQVKQKIQVELYQIPKDIGKQAKAVNETRRKKINKYEVQHQEPIQMKVSETHHIKTKETKKLNNTNSLIITKTQKDQSSSFSDFNEIQDIISQH